MWLLKTLLIITQLSIIHFILIYICYDFLFCFQILKRKKKIPCTADEPKDEFSLEAI